MCLPTDPLDSDEDATACASKKTERTAASLIPSNHQRSSKEIETLVQLRVHERETTFTVNDMVESAVPPVRVLAKFLLSSLPKYFMFRPPSQKQLDTYFPVLSMDWDKLQQQQQHAQSNNSIQITWLGHASLLVQMGGLNILTDPVWSDRCSPAQWFGPKRYRAPPCSLAELCQTINIDVVLISHNHYDHLDRTTVREIAKLAPQAQFVVPLGLQQWLRNNVESQLNIFELDWHETSQILSASSSSSNAEHSSDRTRAVRVTALPMRHWSNRTGDRDKTLWCGYRVQTTDEPAKSFLFPGDTAWFDGLKDMIGERYGPFDVAALPIGAYEPRDFMRHAHMNVDEAVAMKEAIRARHAVPIHWGTFPLTIEPVMEPREKLVQLMGDDTTSFVPWLIGETKRF